VTCDQWDVVVVPFPFTEKPGFKRRPALVLSAPAFNQAGHTILAMVTSSLREVWPGDTRLTELDDAGLHAPCVVRLKLFTLDNRLILGRVGLLGPHDRKALLANLRDLLY
jgi:mRNA interferase MazF